YRPEAAAACEDKGGLSEAGAGAFSASPECGKVAHGSAYCATTIVTPHPKPNKDADFNWPLSRRMPSFQRVPATFISCLTTVIPSSGATRAVLRPIGRPAGASGDGAEA